MTAGRIVELLGDLFADALQVCPAGADFLVFGQIVSDLDARKIVRQGLASPLGPGVGRDFDDRHFRRLGLHLGDPGQRQRQDALEEVLGFFGLGSC